MAVPGTPISLIATHITATSMKLTWAAGSGGVPINYNVQYTPLNQASSTIESLAATSLVITGLSQNTPVSWSVQAANVSGLSAWAASVTTYTLTGPSQPSDYGFSGYPAPTLALRWSDDGGHNWSNTLYSTAGPIGATAQRVMFKRLGSTKLFTGLDRIFELSCADAFKVALIGAEIDP